MMAVCNTATTLSSTVSSSVPEILRRLCSTHMTNEGLRDCMADVMFCRVLFYLFFHTLESVSKLHRHCLNILYRYISLENKHW